MKEKYIQNKIPNLNIQSMAKLRQLLDVPLDDLLMCLKNAPFLYYLIHLTKRSGGYRTINAPNKELKYIQRSILDKLLKQIPLSKYIYGFSSTKTIIDNAWMHAQGDYLLNVDIVNFFPNVHYKRIHKMFLQFGCAEEVAGLLTKLTTLNKCLPQGAPTSPYLATLSLNNLDVRISKLCNANKLKYTRYYDDITISGGKRLLEIVDTVELIIESEGHLIHHEEGKYSVSGPSELKRVTGLEIVNRKPQVPNIDNLHCEISLLKQLKLDELHCNNPYKAMEIIRGKVAFVSQVDEMLGAQLLVELKSISW